MARAESDDECCGGMDVWMKLGDREVSLHIGQSYTPDVFADLNRQAVISLGGLFPEDDDDAREALESLWAQS